MTRRAAARRRVSRQQDGIGSSWSTGGDRADRGMVTIELVFGILIVSVMISVFGWAILLFGVQVACVDSAAAIARQAARGDEAAVAAEKTGLPRGATVQIATGNAEVHVTVRVASQPLDFVPAVHLRADATALMEPGER